MSHPFERRLQLRNQNGAILNVTNTVGAAFEVAQKFVIGINLPHCPSAIVPLVRRGVDGDVQRSVNFRDAMQTIANDFDLGVELGFISQLLKIAAAAKAE